MQNTGHTWRATMLAAFIGLLFAGCSDPKQESSLALRQAVDKAQRSTQRALALMANPYYVDTSTGELSPLDTLIASAGNAASAPADRIDVRPITEPNPRALKELQDAQTELGLVISANSANAGATELSLAQATMASILKIQSQYFADMALHQRQAIRPALDAVRRHLITAAAATSAVKLHDALLKNSTSQIEELLSQSDVQLKEIQDQLTELEKEIAAARPAAQELATKIAQDQRKAGEMERQIKQEGGRNVIERFEPVLELRKQIDAGVLELQSAETSINEKLGTQMVLQTQQTILKTNLETVRATINSRKTTAVSTTKGRETADAQLKAQLAAVPPAAKIAVDAANASQDNLKLALSKQADALKEIAKAITATTSCQLLAEQGAMQMDLASLSLETGSTAAAIDSQLLLIANQWRELNGSDQLPTQNKLENDTLKADAVENFRAAASTYEKAIRAVTNGDLKWVYEGSAAAAYLALAEASPEDRASASSTAATLVEHAKNGRENSPHLNNVVKLAPAK